MFRAVVLFAFFVASQSRTVLESTPFRPFVLRCPKYGGVSEFGLQTVYSTSEGTRHDYLITTACDNIEELFPINAGFFRRLRDSIDITEREECRWSSSTFDPVNENTLSDTCTDREFMAGVSRVIDLKIHFLCCKLRTRELENCHEKSYPIPTVNQPIVQLRVADNIIASLRLNSGVFTALFCQIKLRDLDEIEKDKKSGTKDLETLAVEEIIEETSANNTLIKAPEEATNATIIETEPEVPEVATTLAPAEPEAVTTAAPAEPAANATEAAATTAAQEVANITEVAATTAAQEVANITEEAATTAAQQAANVTEAEKEATTAAPAEPEAATTAAPAEPEAATTAAPAEPEAATTAAPAEPEAATTAAPVQTEAATTAAPVQTEAPAEPEAATTAAAEPPVVEEAATTKAPEAKPEKIPEEVAAIEKIEKELKVDNVKEAIDEQAVAEATAPGRVEVPMEMCPTVEVGGRLTNHFSFCKCLLNMMHKESCKTEPNVPDTATLSCLRLLAELERQNIKWYELTKQVNNN